MATASRPTRRQRAAAAVRRGASAVRTRVASSAPVRTVVRYVNRAAPQGSRRRRAAAAIGKGAGLVAVAQTKALPALVAGYGMGKLERNQRTSQKPIIQDHRNRLIAEAVGLAFLRTIPAGRSPMATALIDGAEGAIGCLYEAYTSGGISEGVIPKK